MSTTQEGAGAVASDSLAAESTRSGGGFGENRDSDPLSVEGGKSTLNNTDTSGATTLSAAPNARSRNDEPTDQSYPEQLGGQGHFSGTHTSQGYTGGPSASSQSGSGSTGGSKQQSGGDEQPFGTTDTDTSDHGVSGASAAKAMGSSSKGDQTSSSSGGSGGGGNTASSYASAVTGGGTSNTSSGNPDTSTSSSGSGGSSGGRGGGGAGNLDVDSAPGYVPSSDFAVGQSGKPHGKNITEGGFDSDDTKNASFNSEIGSKDDPARKAEGDFQKMANTAAGGTGPRQQQEGQGSGGYDALSES